ncbi:hypothetical protein FNU79_16195 [Deinococcus detaillensis]|uniref:Uncharacterized protein n=1 Tax=Deinococcus detaillensis TaxID=2592048 RepID=A0A553UKQ5_9DEIO|nr:hypothetical protein [Deinococcus detaillensis]TSA80783.1 hypothetical protein FNU79_16195 [Deinococcus detaillensis]
MKDPLTVLTYMIGAAILMVLGRYAVTGDPPDKDLLAGLSTIIGGLVTALSVRKKKGDDDDSKSP